MKRSTELIKDRRWCVNQYETQGKSLRQIRKETGLGVNTIKRWLNKHNIATRQGDMVVKEQQSQRLSENPKWKGQHRNNGYIYIYKPDHPNASKTGYVSEHRMVASEMLGRPLTKQDIIHHIDGDRTNNNEQNLFITNKRGHRLAHANLMQIGYELLKQGKIRFQEGIYRWM